MNVFKCDRCREVQPDRTSVTETISTDNSGLEFGLCDDCNRSFEKWLKEPSIPAPLQRLETTPPNDDDIPF